VLYLGLLVLTAHMLLRSAVHHFLAAAVGLASTRSKHSAFTESSNNPPPVLP
jgi:hypothetical protein